MLLHVLSDEAVLQYKCDNYYAPSEERGIAWNDPAIGIEWGIPEDVATLSNKDIQNPRLTDAVELFD